MKAVTVINIIQLPNTEINDLTEMIYALRRVSERTMGTSLVRSINTYVVGLFDTIQDAIDAVDIIMTTLCTGMSCIPLVSAIGHGIGDADNAFAIAHHGKVGNTYLTGIARKQYEKDKAKGSSFVNTNRGETFDEFAFNYRVK